MGLSPMTEEKKGFNNNFEDSIDPTPIDIFIQRCFDREVESIKNANEINSDKFDYYFFRFYEFCDIRRELVNVEKLVPGPSSRFLENTVLSVRDIAKRESVKKTKINHLLDSKKGFIGKISLMAAGLVLFFVLGFTFSESLKGPSKLDASKETSSYRNKIIKKIDAKVKELKASIKNEEEPEEKKRN
jgi:hypothetical protein